MRIRTYASRVTSMTPYLSWPLEQKEFRDENLSCLDFNSVLNQNYKWTESGGSVNKDVSAFKLVDSIKLSEIPDSSFY